MSVYVQQTIAPKLENTLMPGRSQDRCTRQSLMGIGSLTGNIASCRFLTFQAFLSPILRIASDGAIHSAAEFEQGSADILGLSPEDRTQMLASGGMTVLRDRSGWAYYYLFRAGLLERPSRGHYRITERGLQALKDCPDGVNKKYLKQFPEFLEYVNSKPKEGKLIDSASVLETSNQTPQGMIDEAYRVLQEQLAADLLEQIMSKSPAFFEALVVKLLVRMGYGGSEAEAYVTGRSGDGGIDGLINEDRLGLDRIYVQAKRWKEKIGTPQIRDFVGSLAGQGAHKGVFITTSGFQPSVAEYLRGVQHRVVLIDGPRLAALCIEFGIGVVPEGAYTIRKIDASFFESE
ncbi:MAG: restriction endonuclease [Acidobacteria bacterium]|nr:restriction endonuclease [Acidobacteriota bacterium]